MSKSIFVGTPKIGNSIYSKKGCRESIPKSLRDIIATMKLTQEEVEHIAELARLRLSDEEKARYAEQLSEILDYATRLQAVDTSGISPTSSVLPVRGALRPDEPHPGLSLQALLSNATDTEKGQFRVPPILE
jgi:aspartyl-tRNA(Asn)/glutamyl-tRNA(Gln) amidotransferase subunit C